MVFMELQRFAHLTEVTLGTLRVIDNGKVVFECKTIEPQGPDCYESGKNRRIPAGVYNVAWRDSWKFGVTPHLFSEDVAPKRYILIHKGNYRADSLGCVLVGMRHNGHTLLESKKAFDTLCEHMRRLKIDELYIKNLNS